MIGAGAVALVQILLIILKKEEAILKRAKLKRKLLQIALKIWQLDVAEDLCSLH
jgi:hypothetical protein